MDFSFSSICVNLRHLRAIPHSVAAGRTGHSLGKNRASKSPPKRRLTEIRNYGLISYVSKQNSSQGRRGDAAVAGGTGNNPPVACDPSSILHSGKVAHFREDFTTDFTDFTDETPAIRINSLSVPL
jgi:hypothetical protein